MPLDTFNMLHTGPLMVNCFCWVSGAELKEICPFFLKLSSNFKSNPRAGDLKENLSINENICPVKPDLFMNAL